MSNSIQLNDDAINVVEKELQDIIEGFSMTQMTDEDDPVVDINEMIEYSLGLFREKGVEDLKEEHPNAPDSVLLEALDNAIADIDVESDENLQRYLAIS